MLWEDNRNDCFEYGFAIITSAACAKLKWWVDPAGAMLIGSTVRAYHWGEELFVEVDIVTEPERTLREAHDVSQELQGKLETVEGFGRAFVHVDYGKRLLSIFVRNELELLTLPMNFRNIACSWAPENALIESRVVISADFHLGSADHKAGPASEQHIIFTHGRTRNDHHREGLRGRYSRYTTAFYMGQI